MSKLRTVTNGISQGLLFGPPLFNNFVGTGTVGLSAPSSNFADDTNLWDVVDILQCRDDTQRDRDRFER